MKRECHVLVVGGGVAGTIAAVRAARKGVHTILVERNNFPGGTAVTGLHCFICGLYVNDTNVPKHTINKGIVREICSQLKTLAPEKKVLRMGRVYVLPYSRQDLVSVFRSLTKNEKQHIEVLYNTQAVSVRTEQNTIAAVTVRGPKGVFDIVPRAVIDCSGHGVIIQQSGAKYQSSSPKQRQLAGYTFRVKGLKGRDNMAAVRVPYYLAQAYAEKKIPLYLKFTTFTPVDNIDEGLFKISIPPARDGIQLAKKNALVVHQYLCKVLPLFKNSYISDTSSEVLEREGTRLCGEYTLSASDIINARKFPDGVVKNSWPIELWDQKKGPQYRYLNPGDYYEIPVRCLKSQEISNLFCAGRCISVSQEALGSTRVMGTCMSLGEQAGCEAVRMVNTYL
ncbi:MAG: FAD-dependent oxidoreductase [bacterium]